MDHVVPPSFLFEFRMPVPRCASPADGATKPLLDLSPQTELFFPSQMNGDGHTFARAACGWNEDGFGLRVTVSGKSATVAGQSSDLTRSDAVKIWIDTRPTGTVHRATEYCHHFAILPVDLDRDDHPSASIQPIAQQRDQRTQSDVRRFLINTQLTDDGYVLEAWLPGPQLHGWRDVSELQRIGFYIVVQDSELGDQPLSVHDDFPIGYNPSLWATLELQS